MFKLSTICIDTALQSLAPLSSWSHCQSHAGWVVPIPPQSTDAVHRHPWLRRYLQRIYNMSMDNSHSGLNSFNSWIFVPIFTVIEQHLAEIQQNKKLSYRRETARQLPTWRGPRPFSPLLLRPLWLYLNAYGRIWNPPQTYVQRAVRKAHFKLNRHSRSFKVIPICTGRNPERCIVVMCN